MPSNTELRYLNAVNDFIIQILAKYQEEMVFTKTCLTCLFQTNCWVLSRLCNEIHFSSARRMFDNKRNFVLILQRVRRYSDWYAISTICTECLLESYFYLSNQSEGLCVLSKTLRIRGRSSPPPSRFKFCSYKWKTAVLLFLRALNTRSST